jgi:hypothetical protein
LIWGSNNRSQSLHPFPHLTPPLHTQRFAALGSIERNSWLQMLALGILEGKKEIYNLLDKHQDEVGRSTPMRV